MRCWPSGISYVSGTGSQREARRENSRRPLIDRRYFLAYIGGTALGVLAFDELGYITARAAPVAGGNLRARW